MNRDEKAAIRNLVVTMKADGASMEAIVAATKFSEPYIRLILKAQGIINVRPHRPMTQAAKERKKVYVPGAAERAAEMVDLYRNGNQTLTQIGDRFGITRERVRQILKREGFTGIHSGHRIQRATELAESQAAREERREANSVKRYGCTFDELQMLKKIGALRRFSSQKHNAKIREIGWKLSLWEWWCIWDESGHWDERGRGGDRYVMGRHRDEGPYERGNVSIITGSDNIKDFYRYAPHAANRSRPALTHCRNGHELAPDNTYMIRGTKVCRICRLEYQRNLYRKKHGIAA